MLLSICSLQGFSQKNSPIDIQYIEVQDSVLVQEVKKLIAYEENREIRKPKPGEKVYSENLFKKGLGYIEVHMESFYSDPNRVNDGDTLYSYFIDPSWHVFRDDTLDSVYPPFYTYIGGRIVLLYFPILRQVADIRYSKKSKKAFRKKIDKYLEKPEAVTAYNLDGSVAFRDKNFRITYFRFEHDGRHIYILKNKPPILEKEN